MFACTSSTQPFITTSAVLTKRRFLPFFETLLFCLCSNVDLTLILAHFSLIAFSCAPSPACLKVSCAPRYLRSTCTDATWSFLARHEHETRLPDLSWYQSQVQQTQHSPLPSFNNGFSNLAFVNPATGPGRGSVSLPDDNGNDYKGGHEGEAIIAMASPMPAAQSSNPPAAAGEVDEYGLQTKFMNCMKFSVSLSLD